MTAFSAHREERDMQLSSVSRVEHRSIEGTGSLILVSRATDAERRSKSVVYRRKLERRLRLCASLALWE